MILCPLKSQWMVGDGEPPASQSNVTVSPRDPIVSSFGMSSLKNSFCSCAVVRENKVRISTMVVFKWHSLVQLFPWELLSHLADLVVILREIYWCLLGRGYWVFCCCQTRVVCVLYTCETAPASLWQLFFSLFFWRWVLVTIWISKQWSVDCWCKFMRKKNSIAVVRKRKARRTCVYPRGDTPDWSVGRPNFVPFFQGSKNEGNPPKVLSEEWKKSTARFYPPQLFLSPKLRWQKIFLCSSPVLMMEMVPFVFSTKNPCLHVGPKASWRCHHHQFHTNFFLFFFLISEFRHGHIWTILVLKAFNCARTSVLSVRSHALVEKDCIVQFCVKTGMWRRFCACYLIILWFSCRVETLIHAKPFATWMGMSSQGHVLPSYRKNLQACTEWTILITGERDFVHQSLSSFSHQQ